MDKRNIAYITSYSYSQFQFAIFIVLLIPTSPTPRFKSVPCVVSWTNWYDKLFALRAVVVAQLAELLLPLSEVCGSNAVISPCYNENEKFGWRCSFQGVPKTVLLVSHASRIIVS